VTHTQHKTDKGPVGDRAAQEGPVDFAAVTTAFENHGDGAVEREVFDHAVKVAPAVDHLGRVPLQPALAGRREGAKTGRQCHQQTCRSQGPTLHAPTDQGQHHQADQGITLHDAHGARVQAHHMLQIEAKHQHADARQGDQQHPSLGGNGIQVHEGPMNWGHCAPEC